MVKKFLICILFILGSVFYIEDAKALAGKQLQPVLAETDVLEDDPTCSGLFGNSFTEIINSVFSTIQYAGPTLIVVLTLLDIIKIVLSGDSGELKKEFSKFIKRAIAAICLFFIPLFCKLIFDITEINVPEYCIVMDSK